MPRIPTHQYEDDWDNDDDFNIEDDEPRNSKGQRVNPKQHRKDREWEEARRDAWRKRHRDDY